MVLIFTFLKRRSACLSLLLILSLILMSGCVSGIESRQNSFKIATNSSAEQGRTIVVTSPELRKTAVSRKVGRWAVVVGISDYLYDTNWNPRRGIPDLQYAHRDAEAFARFLMSPEGGAFPPDRVMLLTDEQATIKEVRKGIGDFLAGSLEDDVVIIYFAGHGAPDPRNLDNLYLVCHDTEPGNYYGTAFPMRDIDDAIKYNIKSKRIFVLADACHSAGVGGTRGQDAAEKINIYMEKLAESREGVTKVTASRANQLSMEREFPEEGGHGLFTYYLLEALKGEGDNNQDGFVTMNEAYDYLSDKVCSDSHHSQNPWSSPYVSTDIPLGIVDKSALYDIKLRQEAQATETAAKSVYPTPPYANVKIPEDSGIAIKLALAKLAKKEADTALSMINQVIERQDAHKPDALATKIKILLSKDRLKAAEDVEDLLIIPYPDHAAAGRGARAVYDHYLSTALSLNDQQKIQTLKTYVGRHPGGGLVPEAQKELENIRTGIRDRYKNIFNEQVRLARGLIKQNRLDRAVKAIEKAGAIADESRSSYGITLETGVLDTLKVSMQTARKTMEDLKAWEAVKTALAAQSDKEKLRSLDRFVMETPYSPHAGEATHLSRQLKQRLISSLQKKFNANLGRATSALERKDFSGVSTHLGTASDLLIQANDLGVSLDEKNLESLRVRYKTEAGKHRDHMAWSQAEYEVGAISLSTLSGFDGRIAVYKDFRNKWPQNPYVKTATARIAELKAQKEDYRNQKFNGYYASAQDAFINKNYSAAYQALDQAREYADTGQASMISVLAARYNAPPQITIELEKDVVDWEVPITFRYNSTDKENDPVRVVSWSFGDGRESTQDQPVYKYPRWSGGAKQKHYTVTLVVTDGHSTVKKSKTLTVLQKCLPPVKPQKKLDTDIGRRPSGESYLIYKERMRFKFGGDR